MATLNNQRVPKHGDWWIRQTKYDHELMGTWSGGLYVWSILIFRECHSEKLNIKGTFFGVFMQHAGRLSSLWGSQMQQHPWIWSTFRLPRGQRLQKTVERSTIFQRKTFKFASCLTTLSDTRHRQEHVSGNLYSPIILLSSYSKYIVLYIFIPRMSTDYWPHLWNVIISSDFTL